MDTVKENSEKKSFKIPDGVLIVAVSSAVYLFAFYYEMGYISYFGIPKSFIRVSADTILIFGSVVFGVLMGMVALLNVINSWIENPRKISYSLIPIAVVVIFVIYALYMIIFIYSRWNLMIVFIGIILFLIGGIFIFYILRNSLYLDKGIGLDKVIYELITSRIDIAITVYVIFLIFGTILSQMLGEVEATIQEEYLVTNTSPERIVIRVYGENVFCVPLDRNSRKAEDNFVILKMAADSELFFQLEKIGPLETSKTQFILKPTPTVTVITSALPSLIKTSMP